MTAIATAGVPRAGLFQYAANLPYASATYFRNISRVARYLNVDYAESCRIEADSTKEEDVKGFLLRLGGSLSSGEDEKEFLARESQVQGENFANEYEREVEALKRWTDAYVALIVAAGLIVIVAVISMMIYQVGILFVVGLALAMVAVSCLGAWIIYVAAPKEIKTRSKSPSSKLQKRVARISTVTMASAAVVGALMLLLRLDIGWILMAISAIVFPIGLLMRKDDSNITKKDEDMATVVRVLGNVTAATGTTVADALNKIDRRSMGHMEPEITRLRLRIKAGIHPDMCWNALVEETGSELVERTVQMFWDSISVGGEAGAVGKSSSFFASRIAFMRSSRQMTANTFTWLTIPLHLAMVGLLEFIVEIMTLFSTGVANNANALVSATQADLGTQGPQINDLFTFGQVNLTFVNVLVTSVVLVLTASNAFAPKAAEGGHGLKLLFNLSITMTISGALMIIVPLAAESIFNSILNGTP